MNIISGLIQLWKMKMFRTEIILIIFAFLCTLYSGTFFILKELGYINTPFVLKVSGIVGAIVALATILTIASKTFMRAGRILNQFDYVKRDVKKHTLELHDVKDELSTVNTRLAVLETDMSYVKKQLDILVARA